MRSRREVIRSPRRRGRAASAGFRGRAPADAANCAGTRLRSADTSNIRRCTCDRLSGSLLVTLISQPNLGHGRGAAGGGFLDSQGAPCIKASPSGSASTHITTRRSPKQPARAARQPQAKISRRGERVVGCSLESKYPSMNYPSLGNSFCVGQSLSELKAMVCIKLLTPRRRKLERLSCRSLHGTARPQGI